MPITIKEGLPLEGESLCSTCVYAHIRRGFRESEQDVFCGYGAFRPVRFKVARVHRLLRPHSSHALGDGKDCAGDSDGSGTQARGIRRARISAAQAGGIGRAGSRYPK